MTKFSAQTLQKCPMMTVGEILDKKYDNIHYQMYQDALSAYFAAYHSADYDYSYDYRCIELPSAYYDNASKVQIISKTFPYKCFTVDLSPYWGDYMFKDKASYTCIDADEMTVKTAEVKYRDYVKGYAEMESRITGAKYNVSLKDLPNDVREYPDDKSMENTFAYLVNNKIYGDER
jgi:hypothetical protein